MKNFEFARFANFLKWHVVTHKSEIIRQTGIATIAMFLLIRMANMGTYFADAELDVPFHLGFVVMMISFAMCIAAASIFKDMNKKGGFINVSMSPASVLEKYLTLLIYSTVIPFVLMILSYFIGEILNVLLFVIEGHSVQRIFTGDLLNHIFVKPIAEHAIDAIPAAIFGLSIYILGGSIFRKMPFISTSALIIAFMIFVLPLLLQVFLNNMVDMDEWEKFFENAEESIAVLSWGITVVSLLLASLNFYISYRIYKRMQVINNKWINL